MIRKLSLTELIEAASNLDKPEQAILIAAITGEHSGHAGNPPARSRSQLAGEWATLAEESLERAYGDDEPVYSDADLAP
jgi:hypothetical protein